MSVLMEDPGKDLTFRVVRADEIAEVKQEARPALLSGSVLSTDRLILRELLEQDWSCVHEWDSDPEVVRYLTWEQERTETASRAWVREHVARAREEPRLEYKFVIGLPGLARAIGMVELNVRPDRLGGWVAYRMHPTYRGNGYMAEALHRTLQFGFEVLRLHRINGTVDEANMASRHVMERCGMRYEGMSRLESESAGGWGNLMHYALLDREWATHSREAPFVSTRQNIVNSGAPVDARFSEQDGGVEIHFGEIRLREVVEEDWHFFQTSELVPVTTPSSYPLSRLKALPEEQIRDHLNALLESRRQQLRTCHGLIVEAVSEGEIIGFLMLDVSADRLFAWLTYHDCSGCAASPHPDDETPLVDAPRAASPPPSGYPPLLAAPRARRGEEGTTSSDPTEAAGSISLRTVRHSQAVQAVVHFALTHLKVQRISTDSWASNSMANSIFDGTQMQPEACFLEVSQSNGEWQSMTTRAAFPASGTQPSCSG